MAKPQLRNIELWAGDTAPPFVVRFPWDIKDGEAVYIVKTEYGVNTYSSLDPDSGVTIETRGDDPATEARHVVWWIPDELRAGTCEHVQYQLRVKLLNETRTYLYGDITTQGFVL